jgi:hypothetical protein
MLRHARAVVTKTEVTKDQYLPDGRIVKFLWIQSHLLGCYVPSDHRSPQKDRWPTTTTTNPWSWPAICIIKGSSSVSNRLTRFDGFMNLLSPTAHKEQSLRHCGFMNLLSPTAHKEQSQALWWLGILFRPSTQRTKQRIDMNTLHRPKASIGKAQIVSKALPQCTVFPYSQCTLHPSLICDFIHFLIAKCRLFSNTNGTIKFKPLVPEAHAGE